MDGIEWNDPTDFPDLRDGFESSLSEEVLVECQVSGDHTIGSYNFSTFEWVFHCQADLKKFKWRKLSNRYDRFKKLNK